MNLRRIQLPTLARLTFRQCFQGALSGGYAGLLIGSEGGLALKVKAVWNLANEMESVRLIQCRATGIRLRHHVINATVGEADLVGQAVVRWG